MRRVRLLRPLLCGVLLIQATMPGTSAVAANTPAAPTQPRNNPTRQAVNPAPVTTQSSAGPTVVPADGYAFIHFASGFIPNAAGLGPIGLTFDSASNLLVGNYGEGFIYKFGQSGGVASPATRLNQTPLPGQLNGLSFTRDGRLYMARDLPGDVVEVSPSTGQLARTDPVATIECATGLAADPLSGDLFVSNPCGSMPALRRLSGFASGPATVSTYVDAICLDGLTFGPTGTLYAAGCDGTVYQVDGTNKAQPPAVTVLANVPTADGIAVGANPSNPSQPPFLFANRNDGAITKIDLTTNPPTLSDVATQGSRGDFVTVGPDGCLYATQTDEVLKVTNADGTCTLFPGGVVPQLSLSPTTISPAPVVGASVTFTATLRNVTNPGGTNVTFTVSGANPQSSSVPADTSGKATFTYTGRKVGNDSIVAAATAGGTSLTSNTATVNWQAGDNLPPDPTTVATAVDRGQPTDMGSSVQFLYTGSNPIQTGVTAGTIDTKRVVVVRGRVLTRNGLALSGVNVDFLGHPELGKTLSRVDGRFDLAANGGGLLTIRYQKPGYITAERQVQAAWQDYTGVPDVSLIPRDSSVTPIDLTSTAPMQVARGSVMNDASGTRRATLLFPRGTRATMVMPDGTTQDLSTLSVRASEFTVGASGPQTMPAELPQTSGYTYATVFTADEAVSAGAVDVRFDQLLPLYLENFLAFPVGENVPLGAYDARTGQWAPSDNGLVIKILSITGGFANLDVDGSGQPATAAQLAALGITDAERQQVASLYPAGQELWRMRIPHFDQPWDANQGIAPPDDAVPPDQDPDVDDGDPNPDPPSPECGSIIGCESQVLAEDVPITGTPLHLRYASSRVPGRRTGYGLRIPLTRATYPASVVGVVYEVTVAGQVFYKRLGVAPNLSDVFVWDGKDAYGRVLQGKQPVKVRIGYAYNAVYGRTSRFGYNGNGTRITRGGIGVAMRIELFLWRNWSGYLGGWDQSPATAEGLGGWSLDVHHVYDANRAILYEGTGRERNARKLISTLNATAGGGNPPSGVGDGGPATNARLARPQGVAIGPDGSQYIADSNFNRLRRVRPDGIITTIAGTGVSGYGGDGGPAVQAQLNYPTGVALGADGSVYIADTNNHRIRRVAPDGTISTFAGTGTACKAGTGNNCGDGLPAVQGGLNYPSDVTAGSDGSVYIADYLNSRVRRVDPAGTISTLAGTAPGFSGDGGPASQAQLLWPAGLAVASDGSVLIADSNNRVRRVRPNGIITTIVGDGQQASRGDGGAATAASLDTPSKITIATGDLLYIAERGTGGASRIRRVGSDGVISTVAGTGQACDMNTSMCGDTGAATAAGLYDVGGVGVFPSGEVVIADSANNRLRRIGLALSSNQATAQTSGLIPSEDGSQVYVFDSTGRHQRTVDALTGALRYQFSYDASGRLAGVTDGDNNTTTITRDTSGNPTGIVSPYGQRTALSLDANGFLSAITNPAGETVSPTASSNGLLTSLRDARGGLHRFTFDGDGRLTSDQDPAGGVKTLSRSGAPSNYTVTVTTAAGTAQQRATQYSVERLSTGGVHRVTVAPGNVRTDLRIATDGTRTTTYADGTVDTVVVGPDPRWGMQAPIITAARRTTPSGLTGVITMSRSVALANPSDPLVLQSQVDTITVNGRYSTTRYDGSVRTITTSTAAGRGSTKALNSRGYVVSEQVAGLDPVSITYDARGRPSTYTQSSGVTARMTTIAYKSSGPANGYIDTITDALNRVTQFDYDQAGRVTNQTLPGSRSIALTYDGNSNATAITPPGRAAHGLVFNALDEISGYTPPDVGAGTTQTTYTYNPDGQLSHVSRPDGVGIDIAYDSAGRTHSISLPRGQVSYDYNAAGQLITIAAPGSLGLGYGYDGVVQTSTTFSGAVPGMITRSYDTDFRLATLSVNGSGVSMQYDADSLLTRAGALVINRNNSNGLPTGTTLGNLTDTWAYNGLAEPTSYSAAASGSTVFAQQYTRDALGRISQKSETIGGVSDTYAYAYDAASRLKDVRKNGVLTASYAYDSNGNRLILTTQSGTTNGTYDAQDRLTQYGAVTYAYTANGELQSRSSAGQTTSYQYDQLGNLVAATLPNGTQISYMIDGRNRRVGKSVNGTLAQRFIYQDNYHVAAELDSAGNVLSRFVYGTRINIPDYVIRGSSTYRVVADQLGSPRLIVDIATGQIAQRMDFDEFGNVLQDTNPGFQPFGFAGGVYDRDTRLVRFGGRDYDPEPGRWTAKDPLRFAGRQSNLYRYVGDNPINLVDPSGLDDDNTGPLNNSQGIFNVQKSGVYSQYSLNLNFGDLTLQPGVQVNDPRNWVPNPDPNSPWTPSSDVQPGLTCSTKSGFGGFLQWSGDFSSLTAGGQYQNGPFTLQLQTKLGDWTTQLEGDYNNGSNFTATVQISAGPHGGSFTGGLIWKF